MKVVCWEIAATKKSINMLQSSTQPCFAKIINKYRHMETVFRLFFSIFHCAAQQK